MLQGVEEAVGTGMDIRNGRGECKVVLSISSQKELIVEKGLVPFVVNRFRFSTSVFPSAVSMIANLGPINVLLSTELEFQGLCFVGRIDNYDDLP